MSFFEKFGKSAMELKSLRCITVTAVLIALDIVLKLLSIKISNDLKITFAYIALATIGMLYGPTVSFLAGVIADLVGFMFEPTGGFNILFTFIEAFGGLMYGIFLYELKPLGRSEKAAEDSGKTMRGLAVRGLLYGIICSELITLLLCFIGQCLVPGMYDEKGAVTQIGKIAKVILNEPVLYTTIIVGFVYGLIFTVLIGYSVKMGKNGSGIGSVIRIVLSKVLAVVICNLIMTPAAFVISQYMTLDSMLASYPVRLVKNTIQCPVDCIILVITLFPIMAAYQKVFPKEKNRLALRKS